ncbi:FecR family protein [Paracidovorax anthurii]|uniref:FecR family protein n=1 Tax=Paracidovorax anthurii TaxID=78229 RepID=A0A328ZLE1_9BURK|nr:FecR domain-containing protein [Paracidovorax anthurii]RAR86444.1 FecR family protein [Paracidovorax anthurii]
MSAEPPRGAHARPERPGRSPHLPIDDALAPFADALRRHLPTPDEIERAAAARRQGLRQRAAKAAGTGTALAALLAAGLWWADPAWHRDTLATAVGERRTARLPDGSEVRLHSRSRLEVALHVRSRRLALPEGEASFEVAHAAWHRWLPWLQRPFTVQAGAVQVRDIGTVFQVRRQAEAPSAAPGRTDVTVLQGRVSVRPLRGGAPAVELAAGETLHVPDAVPPGTDLPEPLGLDAAALAAATSWREGRLLLEGTPLAEAVAEMQRHRAAPILLADEHAAHLRISGAFDLDRIDQLIDLLPRLAPVAVHRQEDGRVVIASRAGAAHGAP